MAEIEYRETANGRIEIGAHVEILDTPSLRANRDDEKLIGKIGTVRSFGSGAYVGLVYVEVSGQRSPLPLRGVELKPIDGPAEVWCSECDQPATGEVDGRSYCARDMGVAVRAVAARRDTVDKLRPRIVGDLVRSSEFELSITRDVVERSFDRIVAIALPKSKDFPPQLPTPESERAAAQRGDYAL